GRRWKADGCETAGRSKKRRRDRGGGQCKKKKTRSIERFASPHMATGRIVSVSIVMRRAPAGPDENRNLTKNTGKTPILIGPRRRTSIWKSASDGLFQS